MRPSLRILLSICSLGLASLVSAAASAQIVSNFPGTVCKSVQGADAPSIEYIAASVRSSKASPTQVICPLPRLIDVQNGNKGATIIIEYTHVGAATSTCVAASYGAANRLLASTSATLSGVGAQKLDLRGPGKSDVNSNYVVRCTLPAGRAGAIRSIEIVELVR